MRQTAARTQLEIVFGTKPTHRVGLAAGKLASMIQEIHTPFWDECADKWENWLAIARGQNPVKI